MVSGGTVSEAAGGSVSEAAGEVVSAAAGVVASAVAGPAVTVSSGFSEIAAVVVIVTGVVSAAVPDAVLFPGSVSAPGAVPAAVVAPERLPQAETSSIPRHRHKTANLFIILFSGHFFSFPASTKIRNTTMSTATMVDPTGVSATIAASMPSTAHTTDTTAEHTVTDRKLLYTRIADSAGKITSPGVHARGAREILV